jgi:hypothetical protein
MELIEVIGRQEFRRGFVVPFQPATMEISNEGVR